MATSGAILLAAALLLVAQSVSVLAALRVDNHEGALTTIAGHSQLISKSRKLLQESDDVCYEGCYLEPAPLVDPLPVLLFSNVTNITLEACYNAAKASNLTYLAILNGNTCWGGNEFAAGWAPDTDCPLECVPNGPAGGACGTSSKAAMFSLGLCGGLDVPCAPVVSPSPPPPVSYLYCPRGCTAGTLTTRLSDTSSAAQCRMLAVDAGFAFFGVYNGSQCWGAAALPPVLTATQCSLPCDEPGFSCGGDFYSSVYSTSLCSRPPPPTSPSPPPPPSAPSPPPPNPPADPVPEVDVSPPPYEDSSPPPPPPVSAFRCRDRGTLLGPNLPDTPIKLNPKLTNAQNAQVCEDTCAAMPGCKGYFYKTTEWCHLLSRVDGWGKTYTTAFRACRR